MGHFINWRFGVPVKVFQCGQQIGNNDNWLLINETKNMFITVNPDTLYIRSFYKIPVPGISQAYYELIPHKYNTFSPRYPVCQTSDYTAFCYDGDEITILDAGKVKLTPYSDSVIVLTIDGKTIELSAETTAELKKKLGV